MNAEERTKKFVRSWVICLECESNLLSEFKAAQREAIEECVSIVDQFLGPGITILHVPRARANLMARFRALKED